MKGTQELQQAVVGWGFVGLGEEGQKGHWGQAGVSLALCRSSLKLPSLARPLMENEGWETLPTVWGPITTGSMYAAGPVGDGSLRLGQAHHLLSGIPSLEVLCWAALFPPRLRPQLHPISWLTRPQQTWSAVYSEGLSPGRNGMAGC